MLVADNSQLINSLISGGDDYELLFTVPKKSDKTISNIAKKLDLPLSQIGLIGPSNLNHSVTIHDEEGTEIDLTSAGYQHF